MRVRDLDKENYEQNLPEDVKAVLALFPDSYTVDFNANGPDDRADLKTEFFFKFNTNRSYRNIVTNFLIGEKS